MGVDSSANLLFKISADPSEAQGNVQRFRSLLSKDLAGMKAEFGDWAKNVFGDLSTVQGGMLAVAATTAAGLVALGSAMSKAADKAAEYALEIEDGSEKTGIAVEDMSRLKYVAEAVDVSYGSLVSGLSKFAANVDAARDKTSGQAAAFARLKISQAEIEAGSRDLLPLLYRVTDAFRDQLTATERVAVAKALFGRGGVELIEVLKRGSGALREFAAEAERLGLIITEKDVIAAKELKAEMHELKAQTDALTLSFGKMAMPLKTGFLVGLEGLIAGMKALDKQASLNPFANVATFYEAYFRGAEEAYARIQQQVRSGMLDAGKGVEAPGKAAAKTTQEFWGFSQILDQLIGQLAETEGEEAKISHEFAHMAGEIDKTAAEFTKLRKSGKLDPETVKRESAAITAAEMALAQVHAAQLKGLDQKRKAEIEAAATDLRQRLAGQQEQTSATQVAAWDEELNKLRLHLQKKGVLTEENERLLAQLQADGENRIAREQTEAYRQELVTLQQELAGMLTARQTSAERIRYQYDLDLQRFSQVEEEKTLKVAKSEEEREIIRRQYEMNRAAALARYGEDLTALYNSQGWQGVFGNHFAQTIWENEELLRQWSTSANQSHLMVQVSLQSLGQMLRETFDRWAKAMGQNIADAIVYRKSIGEAMRAATAAALESLAAQAFVEAIFSTALGFLRLAQWDFVGAASAFTAAAIFGTVGVAAAVAGRAIAPKSSSASKSSGAGSSGSESTSSSSSSSSSSNQKSVQINIYGHVVGTSGIEQLTDIINEAVADRDVKLLASAVKSEGAVSR